MNKTMYSSYEREFKIRSEVKDLTKEIKSDILKGT